MMGAQALPCQQVAPGMVRLVPRISLRCGFFLIHEKLELSLPVTLLFGPQKMNLLLTIVFGVVGILLSYGFFIPPQLSMFRLIAAVGMMVGYRAGLLLSGLVRQRPKRFLLLAVGAVLCFDFAFGYARMVQMQSVNTSDAVNLGALLGLFFLSLGFSLTFTRVLVPWSKAVDYLARLFRR
jgi:hypothetical protein